MTNVHPIEKSKSEEPNEVYGYEELMFDFENRILEAVGLDVPLQTVSKKLRVALKHIIATVSTQPDQYVEEMIVRSGDSSQEGFERIGEFVTNEVLGINASSSPGLVLHTHVRQAAELGAAVQAEIETKGLK